MEIIVFQKNENPEEALRNFQDFFYSSQMKYLASDLLQEGFSATEIGQAVLKAMTTCQITDVEVRQHFIPIITEINGTLVNDCKLSQLGYGLVLLNADGNIPMVAEWQLKVLSEFLKI